MAIRIASLALLAVSLVSLQDCKPIDVGPSDPDPIDTVKTPPRDTTTYACAGKTSCSAMTSCAEARYYLDHCPFTNMDGDGDGIPCEDQWCGH